MAMPQFDMKFTAPPAPKPVDKSKIWYDGWQDDIMQDIFEENHYPKHTNLCQCVKCDPYHYYQPKDNG